MNKGVLFIVSAASATGKDTVVSEVIRKSAGNAVLSVSMTTRQPRGEEQEGVHYFYVSEEAFKNNISNGLMLEYAKYGRYYYGTPLEPVEKWLNEGKTVFLIIEVQGAAIVREKMPGARSIFILPPSLDILEKRLRGRNSDTEDSILRRMTIARDEIARAGEYDYIIVNDDLETAVEEFSSLCRYEKCVLNGMPVQEADVIVADKSRKNKMMNTVSEVLKND